MIQLQALLCHISGVTKEKHENPPSGYPVSRPRFEPGTSRLRSNCVKNSTVTFGEEGFARLRTSSSISF